LRIHSAAILYFDAVRRAGSIREAARRLNVASSAVNRQILKLEAEIGAPLFDRLPGGIKLTAAGEALARHAIVVLQDLERARSDIEGLKGAHTGHISVAAVASLCTTILPNTIDKLRRRAPQVTVSIVTEGSFAIPALVVSGNADIGVAFALTRSRELRQVVNGQFSLGAIMKSNHPLANRSTIDLKACLEYPLILSTPELSINHLLAPAFARLSHPPIPIVTADSIELMRGLAERGTGIAFQTTIGLERELSERRLVHVPLKIDGPVLADLGVYVRTERSFPATLDLFVQLLGDEIRAQQDSERHGPTAP